MNGNTLKIKLDKVYSEYAISEFIQNDPISIPHKFIKLQDIEIAGFFSAIFSWGRRDTIISKANELLDIFNGCPYEFVLHYNSKQKTKIQNFKHRTFNAVDLDFYIQALQEQYRNSNSLENAFTEHILDDTPNEPSNIEPYLVGFYNYMSNIVNHEQRSMKHISTPLKKAACKRLCMFLRWMVRSDEIDLGIWKKIKPSQLIIPLDVHVINVSRRIGILEDNDMPNWKTAIKLTEKLRKFDKVDPVKYDLALFSMGVNSVLDVKPFPNQN